MIGVDKERPTLREAATAVYQSLPSGEQERIDNLLQALDSELRVRLNNKNSVKAGLDLGKTSLNLGQTGQLELLAALGVFLQRKKIPNG